MKLLKLKNRRFFSRPNNYLFGLSGVAGFLIIWELASRLRLVNKILISSPEEVLMSEFELFRSGNIFSHLFRSFEEIILGFFLAILLGVSLGMIIGRFEKLEKITHPLIYSLYSTPAIAIFPLILIWLGFSIWTKVAIIFLASFFPILINTISAVKNLNPEFLMLAKSYGARDFDIFKSITLPSSLPFIISGIKIAVPRSITGMVVGEFFASNEGLGYLISYYGAVYQTDNLLAVILVIISLSLTFSWVLGRVEKRLETWRPEKAS